MPQFMQVGLRRRRGVRLAVGLLVEELRQGEALGGVHRPEDEVGLLERAEVLELHLSTAKRQHLRARQLARLADGGGPGGGRNKAVNRFGFWLIGTSQLVPFC